MDEEDLELGDKVKDTVTGFVGAAVTISKYLNGCVQVEVAPRVKKGEENKFPDSVFIDIQQLKLIRRGSRKKEEPKGGPYRKGRYGKC